MFLVIAGWLARGLQPAVGPRVVFLWISGGGGVVVVCGLIDHCCAVPVPATASRPRQW